MTADRVLAGRYRLTSRLGRTDVWRARDELLHRDVAVTRIRPVPGGARESEVPDGRRAPGEDLVAEFVAAGEAVRRRSVALTAIHDLVVDDGASWLVMRLDTRGRRRRTLIVAAVCVTAVAATAAVLVVVGARTPSVTALPRACDLLTVKDAEALISRAKVSATAPPTPNPTVTDCEFATGDEALRAARNPVLLVNLKWYRDGADKAVTDIADRRQKSGSYLGTLFPGAPRSRHFISVPDLGDEAFFFGGTHGDDKGRTLESLVVYRLGNVVVLVAHSRQNATRASDAEAVGPIKERVIEAARRTAEVLER